MPTRPSPRSERLGTPNTPAIRFTRGPFFEASLVRVCYGLSGCSPPWTDRTKFPWPTGGFYIQASGGSVALPAAGYDYNSTGLLCWRDFHPQEWQLASLHQKARASPPCRMTQRTSLRPTSSAKISFRARRRPLVTRFRGPLLRLTSAIALRRDTDAEPASAPAAAPGGEAASVTRRFSA